MTSAQLRQQYAAGQRSFIGESLVGQDLTGGGLPAIRLIDCDLTNANLANVDLNGASLDGSNLAGTNFSGASLTNASLMGTSGAGALFSGANLAGAIVLGAELSQAQIAGMAHRPLTLTGTHDWGDGAGSPLPLGASYDPVRDVFNFVLYSENATEVTLLVYTPADLVNPSFTVTLDTLRNRTDHRWHVQVAAGALGQAAYYGYRISGNGRRFDPAKVLLDPYAKRLFFPPGFSRAAAASPGPNPGQAILAELPEKQPAAFVPTSGEDHTTDTVIYEMHVKGFTANLNSGVTMNRRGTYLGVIDKIPHLVELGVTVVELLPVFQYVAEIGGDYWGYMPINFFAPHQAYATTPDAATAETEFRAMVDAFHAVGIEVILDVVYNHTAEQGDGGPTLSFRGIDDQIYYYLDGQGNYIDFSGTGNGFRTGHPAVCRLILDSLKHWINFYGIDGFRFDLAGILARDINGNLDASNIPTLDAITSDPIFKGCRFIAEPYDLKTGSFEFPGTSWLQWNNSYRDVIRGFLRGDNSLVSVLMTRVYGSSDIFPDSLPRSARAYQSVNFADCHDGFCLWDLVSYNVKHNQANLALGALSEGGDNENHSSNNGFEGTVGAPASVLALRRRQIRNFMTVLMMSQGTPMFVAGDEFLRTQGGNNNPYNQDNPTSWLDWDLLAANPDIFRFFQRLIAFRQSIGTIGSRRFWRGAISYHGIGLNPDQGDTSHTLAYCLHGDTYGGPGTSLDVYVMINAFTSALDFAIQSGAAGQWLRVIDTSLASPNDIVDVGTSVPMPGLTYTVQARSVAVLVRANGS